MNSDLINFFESRACDNRGRTIRDIWEFNISDLESVHDYIQWLFPLFIRSEYNRFAPLLDNATVEHIRVCLVCQDAFCKSISLMSRFYCGSSHWMSIDNHNLLRITRIIQSIAILQSSVNAAHFFNKIILCCNKVGFNPPMDTMDYWKNASST